jgi:hypothetical protein
VRGAAYLDCHVDDLADEATRSGPLPRALVAVSNVLTVTLPRSDYCRVIHSTIEQDVTMAQQIDPRGPRFAAALTSAVLAVVLIAAPSGWATALLAVQATVFALGATGGVTWTPYALLFRSFVRPRLDAPRHLEDAAPPQFAQGFGLAFAIVGTLGFLAGATWLGLVATGLALAAALLNAVFGFCLGCEIYLLTLRARASSRHQRGGLTRTTT